jgi:hypothetical protein
MEQADYVAYVGIVETMDIYTDAGTLCGSKFKSMVIDGIKGASSGETLEWVTADRDKGDKIGSFSIVFLAKSGRYCDKACSPNCLDPGEWEPDAFCHALEDHRLVHWGYGLLRVEGPLEGWDRAVSVPFPVILPKSLKTKPHYINHTNGTRVGGYSWVELQAMIAYLKSLRH